MFSVNPLGQSELPHQDLLVQLAVAEHGIQMLAFDEFEHDLVSETLKKTQTLNCKEECLENMDCITHK